MQDVNLNLAQVTSGCLGQAQVVPEVVINLIAILIKAASTAASNSIEVKLVMRAALMSLRWTPRLGERSCTEDEGERESVVVLDGEPDDQIHLSCLATTLDPCLINILRSCRSRSRVELEGFRVILEESVVAA